MQCDHDDTHRLRCVHCGYDLFGLPSDICPECGSAFQRTLPDNVPDADQAPIAAAVAVFVAIPAIVTVIKVSLRAVSYCGGCGCGRYRNIDIHIAMILAVHVVALVCWWYARHDLICSRIAGSALLALITSWVTSIVIQGLA